jgi:phospholipid/cholesterol/gamma-HCH transport system substrate-binding protein
VQQLTAGTGSARIIRWVAGLLALLVIALIIIVPGSGTYVVTAEFDQVYGLIPGGLVDVGGVPVGSVRSIWLGTDGYPRVRMSIDDSIQLSRSVRAVIATPSVAGEVNRVVELLPGSGAPLTSGATILRSQTSEPQEFDQVLSILNPGTRSEVRSLLSRFDRATAGTGPAISRTLASSAGALNATAAVVGELTAGTSSLSSLIDQAGNVTAAIDRDPGGLGRLATQLSALLTTTADRQRALNTIIRRAPSDLAAGIAALHRVDRSVPNLRALVHESTPAIVALHAVAPDLRGFLTAARPALAQLQPIVAQGAGQLHAIEPLLPAALSLFAPAAQAFASLIPISNELRARFPDAFSFFVNWSEFFNDYDANGHGGRVGLALTNPPTDLIGPSDSQPGMLARPFLRDPGVLSGSPWTNYRKSFIGPGQ